MREKGELQTPPNGDMYVNELSFIIPAYNEEKLLPKVLSAIKRHVVSLVYQIVVVDNGSTDATTQIASDFGATVLVDSSKTIAGLRNLGARYASARTLVFLDADVIITKQWAENIFDVIESIQKNSRIITGSRYGISTNPSWIERHWFLPMTREKGKYINGGHLIIDTHLFHEVGGFSDSLRTGEDWEFCVRAKQNGIMIINNPNLLVIHEGYPKTISQFIDREKWLGIQDFCDISSFCKSRPAIFGLSYCLSGIIGAALFLYHRSVAYIAIAIIINSTLCLTATLSRKKQFRLNVPVYFFLYNVYFFARGFALIHRLVGKCSRDDN